MIHGLGPDSSVDCHEKPAHEGQTSRSLSGPFRTLGIVASVAAATSSGVQPTGIDWYDFLLLTGMAVALSWFARSTPTIVWAIAAAAAVLTSGVVGLAGWLLLSASTIVAWRRHGPFATRPPSEFHELLVASASVGAAASLLRLQDVLVGYSSAGVVTVVLIVSAAVGLPRVTPRARRTVRVGSTVLCLAAVVVTIGTWSSVRTLRDDASDAAAAARQGVDLLRSGDSDAAFSSFEQAEEGLHGIDSVLGGTWPTLALGVPLVSQNVQAAQATTSTATRLASASRTLVDSASLEALLVDGSVDLAQVEEIRQAMLDVERALNTGSAGLGEVDSAWIAPPLRAEMQKFSAEVGRADDILSTVDQLTAVLPALLGGGEDRTYLVVAANPAEARELGGFAGGYAVVSASDGVLDVVDSARAAQLNHSPTTIDALDGPYPQRFLEHRPWEFGQNFTAMKDLPTLTRALADLFPSMSGHSIDGVMYLDPFALEALVALTGPVEIPLGGSGGNSTLTMTEDNTAQFFLVDQYADFPEQADRTAIFEQLMSAFFRNLTTTSDVSADNIGRLVEVVRQDRLSFSTLDPSEVEALADNGLAGTFGWPDDVAQRPRGDFLAVSHLNASPNKLDAYLKRSIAYAAEVDPLTGETSAEVSVTLTNDAPAELSNYVAGNRQDLAFATNRAVLVIHSPLELLRSTASPEPAFQRTFREFGLFRHEQIVIIPQGESRTVTFELAGTLALGENYRLEIDHQPLVHPDRLTVTLGDERVGRRLTADMVLEFDLP